MKIFRRYKHSGKTVGYLVGDTEDTAIKMRLENCRSQKFENAKLCADGEFKAKDGYHIVTEDITRYKEDRSKEIGVSNKGKANNSASKEVVVVKSKKPTVVQNLPVATTSKSGAPQSSTPSPKSKSAKKKSGYQIDHTIAGHEFIGLCRRLRKAIRLNKLTVDTSIHGANKGDNDQYFKFIQFCGEDIDKFICDYLMCMQPCTLAYKSHPSNKGSNNLTVVLDLGYQVSLYIKISEDDNMVISFHDDNFKGRNMTSSVKRKLFHFDENSSKPDSMGSEYSYILVNSPITDPSEHFFDVYLSRGFSVLKQRIRGEYCASDLIKVKTTELYNAVKELMTSTLLDICTLYNMDADRSFPNVLSRLNNPTLSEFSFTSYGDTTATRLSLLIDIYPLISNLKGSSEYRDILTLVEYVIEELVFIEERQDLLLALKDRYRHVKTNKALSVAYACLGDSDV